MFFKLYPRTAVSFFIALTFFVPFTEYGTSAQTITRIIDQSISPQGEVASDMAINPMTNRIYLPGPNGINGENGINIIDGSSNTLIGSISNGHYVGPLDINTASNLIFNLDSAGSVLHVLDANTNLYVTGKDLSSLIYGDAVGPAVDSTRNRVYVQAILTEPVLLVLNGADLSTIAVIPIDIESVDSARYYWTFRFGGHGVGVNETTNRIYFPGRDLSNNETPTLAIINGSDYTVTRITLDFTVNGDVTVDETTNRIYLTGFTTDSNGGQHHLLAVVDGNTNNVIAEIPLDTQNAPSQLALDPVHDRIYTQVTGFYEGGQSAIAIIDSRNHAVLNYFLYEPGACVHSTITHAAVFNPNNGLVYQTGTSCENGLLIVDAIDFSTSPITATGAVTALADAAILTFDNITSPGSVSVTPIADASEAGEVPGGFAISESLAFEVSTTATFSGLVTSCFNVTNVSDEIEFLNLRVLHRELNTSTSEYELVDRTSSHDFANRRICATTTSFSPFYLAKVGNQVSALFDQTRAYRAGSTIPIKVRMLDVNAQNISASNLPLKVRGLRRIGSATSSVVTDAGNSNADNEFRYESGAGRYIYNLQTTGLTAGKYVLSFYVGTDRSFFHTVEFQIR